MHVCVFPACFISSLIKLPVIGRLEEMISVFINEGVTQSWAEHLVGAVCVVQLGSSQVAFSAAHQPEQTVSVQCYSLVIFYYPDLEQ